MLNCIEIEKERMAFYYKEKIHKKEVEIKKD
jgi:hypothetical protein